MTSMLGRYIGAFVGPLAIGAASTRVRRPVVLSSLFGATSGAVLGALAGCVAEAIAQRHDRRSMLGMYIAIAVFLPVGLFGGWYGGRAVLANRDAARSPAEKTV
jgi:uncharacterized membrane protein YeaQ/YmgE (transglycosylase-associated protein family)